MSSSTSSSSLSLSRCVTACTNHDAFTVSYKFLRPRDPTNELKIWEAARATAAAPPYFKPFLRHDSTETYTDGAIHHNCPVSIADDERRLLWEEVSDWPPDIMLSLGTGLGTSQRKRHSPSPSAATPATPTAGPPDNVRNWLQRSHGLGLMFWAAKTIVESQLNCEEAWKKYCARAAPPGRAQSLENLRRNVRLNVEFQGPRPDLDDVEKLDNVEHCVRSYMEGPKFSAQIHEVAHMLVASSFYFEKFASGVLERSTGMYRYDGKDPRLSEASVAGYQRLIEA